MTRSVRILPQNPDAVVNTAVSDLAQPLRPPSENSKILILPKLNLRKPSAPRREVMYVFGRR